MAEKGRDMGKVAKVWTVIGIIFLIVLVTVIYQMYKHKIALPEETYSKMPSATYTTPQELNLNGNETSDNTSEQTTQ